MGTDRQEVSRQKAREPEPKEPNPFLFLLIAGALAVVALLRMAAPNGETIAPTLSPKEEKKLAKRLKEIDDSEQYVLLAEVDGWYPCLHKGRPVCYLLAGEVWKYGVTSKGKFGRYSTDFYMKHQVSYITQFKGNFADCLKQEQIRLFNYPYLPENLARPLTDRLPRPPYNPIMR